MEHAGAHTRRHTDATSGGTLVLTIVVMAILLLTAAVPAVADVVMVRLQGKFSDGGTFSGLFWLDRSMTFSDGQCDALSLWDIVTTAGPPPCAGCAPGLPGWTYDENDPGVALGSCIYPNAPDPGFTLAFASQSSDGEITYALTLQAPGNPLPAFDGGDIRGGEEQPR